ncbi:MAG TPA: hypothetical protein VJT33_07795 [bacterium]|nr:hypothetical protein [bacterium]
MRTAVLLMLLGVVVVASLPAAEGYEDKPLTVRIVTPYMRGPGRLGADVVVDGLQAEPSPSVEWRIEIGAQTVHHPPSPLIARRVPATIDLPAGRVRVADIAVAEFMPVPPLDDDLPVSVEITVRQGDASAAVRTTTVVRLPTVIVPGYLNEIAEAADPQVISELERRGYSAEGPSPDVFWFPYRSRKLSLREAAAELAAFVHNVVTPATYAARINVVGYSLGGLMARWNIAFEPGWERLVNRLFLVGTPNEGAVASYVYAWYPLGALARTPAARVLLPTFPFWRPDEGAQWSIPADAQNTALAELNRHPLPPSVRAYAFYGRREGATLSGVTGQFPNLRFSWGPGDGIVLTASALGLAMNGGGGAPGLADRFAATVDVGPQRHLNLLAAAIPKIADILTNRTAARTAPRGFRAAAPACRSGFQEGHVGVSLCGVF